MMSIFKCCSVFLLLNVLTGISSGGETKYVCPGESVPAFQNITSAICPANVSLYKNDPENSTGSLSTWSMLNYNLHSKKDVENVVLDDIGTIWIKNVYLRDEGKYFIMCETDASSNLIQDVQICVMKPPTTKCRPKIVELGDNLYATLDYKECGIPAATLHWKKNGIVLQNGDRLLKLTAEKEGTYYACIEGPALQCATDSVKQHNCSTFIIPRDRSQIVSSSSKLWDMKTIVFILVGVLLAVSVLSTH